MFPEGRHLGVLSASFSGERWVKAAVQHSKYLLSEEPTIQPGVYVGVLSVLSYVYNTDAITHACFIFSALVLVSSTERGFRVVVNSEMRSMVPWMQVKADSTLTDEEWNWVRFWRLRKEKNIVEGDVKDWMVTSMGESQMNFQHRLRYAMLQLEVYPSCLVSFLFDSCHSF